LKDRGGGRAIRSHSQFNGRKNVILTFSAGVWTLKAILTFNIADGRVNFETWQYVEL
jgi:hypothetical protein